MIFAGKVLHLEIKALSTRPGKSMGSEDQPRGVLIAYASFPDIMLVGLLMPYSYPIAFSEFAES